MNTRNASIVIVRPRLAFRVFICRIRAKRGATARNADNELVLSVAPW
jgi:hypothetical protein